MNMPICKENKVLPMRLSIMHSFWHSVEWFSTYNLCNMTNFVQEVQKLFTKSRRVCYNANTLTGEAFNFWLSA